MNLFSNKQCAWLVALIFFCTLFAIVAIPTLTNSKYNPRVVFHGKYTYQWVAVTYFPGEKDTMNIKLQNEPDEETLYLNTKGCLVKEKGLMVESVVCGVREFKVLAKKQEDQ